MAREASRSFFHINDTSTHDSLTNISPTRNNEKPLSAKETAQSSVSVPPSSQAPQSYQAFSEATNFRLVFHTRADKSVEYPSPRIQFQLYPSILLFPTESKSRSYGRFERDARHKVARPIILKTATSTVEGDEETGVC